MPLCRASWWFLSHEEGHGILFCLEFCCGLEHVRHGSHISISWYYKTESYLNLQPSCSSLPNAGIPGVNHCCQCWEWRALISLRFWVLLCILFACFRSPSVYKGSYSHWLWKRYCCEGEKSLNLRGWKRFALLPFWKYHCVWLNMIDKKCKEIRWCFNKSKYSRMQRYSQELLASLAANLSF